MACQFSATYELARPPSAKGTMPGKTYGRRPLFERNIIARVKTNSSPSALMPRFGALLCKSNYGRLPAPMPQLRGYLSLSPRPLFPIARR